MPSAAWTPSPTATDPDDGAAQRSLTDVSATLGSLQKVDDYPLYTMRYYGPYTQTAASLEVAEEATRRPAYRGWACSLFAALGDGRRRVYGRNFDWRYSPALLLFTDPPDGYASVSMVDLAYLVDPADILRLTDLALEDRKALLDAPFWPFDGMNEHGLVIGMAAVPESEMPHKTGRETIDSLGIIREMLDHARDASQAVTILGQYSITWDGGPPLHYLIADASGQSMLVEFYNGEMVLIPSPGRAPWHVATNHLRAPLDDDSSSGCWRYETIHSRLAAAGGSMTIGDAADLLADVAQENTQWSVVYDLSRRSVHVAMGRAYQALHTFHLESERFSPHGGG
jgi:hypothetical protein